MKTGRGSTGRCNPRKGIFYISSPPKALFNQEETGWVTRYCAWVSHPRIEHEYANSDRLVPARSLIYLKWQEAASHSSIRVLFADGNCSLDNNYCLTRRRGVKRASHNVRRTSWGWLLMCIGRPGATNDGVCGLEGKRWRRKRNCPPCVLRQVQDASRTRR